VKRPTIKVALVAILSVIALTVLGLSATSLLSLRSVASASAEIGNYWVERLLVAREIKGEFSNVRLILARHAMVAGDAKGIEDEGARLKTSIETVQKSIAQYEAGVRTEKGRELIGKVKPLLANYLGESEKYVSLIKEGKEKEAFSHFKTELKPLADAVNTQIAELVDFVVESAHNKVTESAAAASTAFMITVLVAVAALLMCVGAMVYAVGGIATPIQRITDAMRRLADGDKAREIPFGKRADEIGAMAGAVEVFRQNAINNERLEEQAAVARKDSEAGRVAEQQRVQREAEQLRMATSALGSSLKRLASGDLTCRINTQFAQDYEALREDFNATVDQLSQTIGAVSVAVQNMDSGTREIASGANDLSKRTEQQAASLEETAAALDEITSNVASSSKMTEEARGVAQAANQSATKSFEVVSHAEEAMGRIEESSQQISNIIGVIDEIAFQTNLLALNAGVEAARAGEAGKGFAVVAQEVRELAQRSAKAAKEIKGLIQTSSAEVEGGVKLVRDTGLALKTIGDYISQINKHMQSIAISAQEQSTGLSQVNVAVNQMDQTTQQNAAMVEESTAAAASLSQESAKLRDLVAQFKLDQAQAQTRALRQTAAVMANPVRAATPSKAPVPQAKSASRPVVQGNLAHKADSWEEF
jgi:methyl-accepting chemotaxis protein-1 (serine sensor receptor)